MFSKKDINDLFRVPAGKKVRMKDYYPGWKQTDKFKELGKEAVKEGARQKLEQDLKDLSAAQELLYADDRYSVLIVFQAMDAAGKDGTIKHVMSGVNPQGCEVYSFKQPTPKELQHNFLWRYTRCLPERGRIGIFNRSYYEDVLIVKVHPELIGGKLPRNIKKEGKGFWEDEDINNLEHHLVRNGTIILKFFLNVSKEEQKERFLDRLNRPEKNWKFSSSDLESRSHWDDYMKVYEDALSGTSTDWAPWYIIPADYKWVTRAAVADIVTSAIQDLDLKYPEVSAEQKKHLAEARRTLEKEE